MFGISKARRASPWEDELRRILRHLRDRNFEVRDLIFDRPARAAEVAEVETRLGFELPPACKEAFLSISRHIGFWWFAPDNLTFPAPFAANFSGHLEWELEALPNYDQQRRQGCEAGLADADDPVCAPWRNTLAFCSIGNGDMLGIDRSQGGSEGIIYLDHEAGTGNGYFLADNLLDLVKRWVPLACAGGEDWQWRPFTTNASSGIDPDCDNAVSWQKLLGLAAQ